MKQRNLAQLQFYKLFNKTISTDKEQIAILILLNVVHTLFIE